MAISHTGHNHPATPAARAACRKLAASGGSPTRQRIEADGYVANHIRKTVANAAMKARIDRRATGCTIDQLHCENCGQLDPGHHEGYTACCNELLSYSRTDCRNHHAN